MEDSLRGLNGNRGALPLTVEVHCCPPTTPLDPLVPTHYLVLTDMTCKLHQVVLAPRKEVGGAGGVGTSGT